MLPAFASRNEDPSSLPWSQVIERRSSVGRVTMRLRNPSSVCPLFSTIFRSIGIEGRLSRGPAQARPACQESSLSAEDVGAHVTSNSVRRCRRHPL